MSGIASLPWVRLHALKDYYDMVALALEHPGLRVTFNVVPSLVDQIEDVAAEGAQDPALLLARRDAGTLTSEERHLLLDLFFSVPYRTRIAPFPRYAALYHKRGGRGPEGTFADAAPRFKDRDLRDLMVWFHLAWSGETLGRSEVVRSLIRKGEGFTESEKAALLDAQQEFLRGVLPKLRSAADEGAIEISTSPYYHPILPLVCDSDSAHESSPGLPVPHPHFRRQGDAVEQVRDAVARHREVFGTSPGGMWPSEGSLSEEVVRIMGAEGIRWAASDEGVLANAIALSSWGGWPGGRLPHDTICRAYRLQGSGPALFFRDRELSDLLGFTYSAWGSEAAAEDFTRRLLVVRNRIGATSADAVLPVILDGENAWEHYPDNGVHFMRSLYRRLTATAGIRTTTFSEYLGASPEPLRLERLRAGSWIRSDFTTWIGHPEKNLAWDLLRGARESFDRRAGEIPEEDRRLARRCLMAAEGSDWFWWYGEEHSSEEDPIFDASFRGLLRETHRLLGEVPPVRLSEPIMGRERRALFEPPTGALRPTIDGRLTDYFEWLPAGRCEASVGFGTMRPGASPMERIAFGWEPGHLYIRVDPAGGTGGNLLEGAGLVVALSRPAERRIRIQATRGSREPTADLPSVRCAAGRVIEIDVPLQAVGAADGDTLAFSVAHESRSGAVDRLPRDGEIVLEAVPVWDWSV